MSREVKTDSGFIVPGISRVIIDPTDKINRKGQAYDMELIKKNILSIIKLVNDINEKLKNMTGNKMIYDAKKELDDAFEIFYRISSYISEIALPNLKEADEIARFK